MATRLGGGEMGLVEKGVEPTQQACTLASGGKMKAAICNETKELTFEVSQRGRVGKLRVVILLDFQPRTHKYTMQPQFLKLPDGARKATRNLQL